MYSQLAIRVMPKLVKRRMITINQNDLRDILAPIGKRNRP